jgi:hypothetical protein
MHAPARVRSLWAVAIMAAALAAVPPASADLRISDLEVFLNDHELTVNVALLGAIPVTFHEGLQSGIPAHVRYTVELWQYQRYWWDNLLLSHVVERQLAYNVVTKEYRVSALQGESREPHLTRDMRDALRVLSELRSLKLTPAGSMDPTEIIYVRVHAETALNGENSFVARMAGTAEQTMRQSDYRTLVPVQ